MKQGSGADLANAVCETRSSECLFIPTLRGIPRKTPAS